MATRAERLRALLEQAFSPSLMRIEDDSHRHAGHSGAREAGETHFNVLVVAAAFEGMSRVARARAAHAALDSEFEGGMHALSLTLRSPREQADNGGQAL